MTFARPDLLWLIVALPLIVGAAICGFARRRRRVVALLGDVDLVRRLGAEDLHRFPSRRLVLVGLAAAALGIAAAGPQWGTRVVETQSRALDLVFALDISKSMWARDLTPNRLERERLLVRRLLRELRGDRIGLVAFAGRAYVLSPLTVDHGALQLYLDALDPAIVSQGGSSLASAIRQATDLARGETVSGADRAVVLVTDGEALEDASAVIEAAQRAAAAGVVIFPVGMGTPQGAPVPEIHPATGAVEGYKRDESGDVVISRRDDRLLERIASITGGRYIRADQAGATERLLADLRGLERSAAGADRRTHAENRFAWFVGLALLLLAADAVYARGAPLRGMFHPSWLRRIRRGAAMGRVAGASMLVILLGLGIGDIERGNRLYRDGRYTEAVEAYREALADGDDSPVLRYNLGTALVRLGRYDEAEQHLRAALASIDPDTRERTYYNLGNRFLEAGRASEDPEARSRLLEAAADAYKRALRLDPSDTDAKWNLELALQEQQKSPPSAGGGDQQEKEQNQAQDQQGGAGPQQTPSNPSGSESRSDRGQAPGTMSREQAERILSAVEQDERELFREKLRQGRRRTPVARDW